MNSKAKRKANFRVLKDQIKLSFLTKISYLLTYFLPIAAISYKKAFVWSRILVRQFKDIMETDINGLFLFNII